jgi:ribonuclease P protein component
MGDHSHSTPPLPSQAPITITQRADFLRLNRGRKTVTPYFILRSAPHAEGQTRVGYTVTTKCGNAVVRNRIKRRLRALVRELFAAHATPGMDYVFIALAQANPSAADVAYDALRESMVRALKHAGQAA